MSRALFVLLQVLAMTYVPRVASAKTCTGDIQIEKLASVQIKKVAQCDTITGELTFIRTQLNDIDLPNLTSVGSLSIINNDALTSLEGLSGLTTVGNLTIDYNHALTSLDGLDGLRTVDRNLRVTSHDTLSDVSSLAGITAIGGELNISSTRVLATIDMPNLETVGGIIVNGSKLKTINMPALQVVTGQLNFCTRDVLTTITMPSIETVGGNVVLDYRPWLVLDLPDELMRDLEESWGDVQSKKEADSKKKVDKWAHMKGDGVSRQQEESSSDTETMTLDLSGLDLSGASEAGPKTVSQSGSSAVSGSIPSYYSDLQGFDGLPHECKLQFMAATEPGMGDGMNPVYTAKVARYTTEDKKRVMSPFVSTYYRKIECMKKVRSGADIDVSVIRKHAASKEPAELAHTIRVDPEYEIQMIDSTCGQAMNASGTYMVNNIFGQTLGKSWSTNLACTDDLELYLSTW